MTMTTSLDSHSGTTDDVSELVLLLRDMSRDTKAMIATLQDEVSGLREIVGSLQVELITAREWWQSSQEKSRSQDVSRARHPYTERIRECSSISLSRQPMTPPVESSILQPASSNIDLSPTQTTSSVSCISSLDCHECSTLVAEAGSFADASPQLVEFRHFQTTNLKPEIYITSTAQHQSTREGTSMMIEVQLAQSPLRISPVTGPWYPNISAFSATSTDNDFISPIAPPLFHPVPKHKPHMSPADRLLTITIPPEKSPCVLSYTPAVHSFSFLPAHFGSAEFQFDGVFVVGETTPSERFGSPLINESPVSDTTLISSECDDTEDPLDKLLREEPARYYRSKQ